MDAKIVQFGDEPKREHEALTDHDVQDYDDQDEDCNEFHLMCLNEKKDEKVANLAKRVYLALTKGEKGLSEDSLKGFSEIIQEVIVVLDNDFRESLNELSSDEDRRRKRLAIFYTFMNDLVLLDSSGKISAYFVDKEIRRIIDSFNIPNHVSYHSAKARLVAPNIHLYNFLYEIAALIENNLIQINFVEEVVAPGRILRNVFEALHKNYIMQLDNVQTRLSFTKNKNLNLDEEIEKNQREIQSAYKEKLRDILFRFVSGKNIEASLQPTFNIDTGALALEIMRHLQSLFSKTVEEKYAIEPQYPQYNNNNEELKNLLLIEFNKINKKIEQTFSNEITCQVATEDEDEHDRFNDQSMVVFKTDIIDAIERNSKAIKESIENVEQAIVSVFDERMAVFIEMQTKMEENLAKFSSMLNVIQEGNYMLQDLKTTITDNSSSLHTKINTLQEGVSDTKKIAEELKEMDISKHIDMGKLRDAAQELFAK